MRLFYFLLLSFPAFAQIDIGNGSSPCTNTDLQGGGTVNCSSVTITTGFTLSPTAILDLKVTGDVFIDGDIYLDGGQGNNNVNFNGSGGTPGPGGEEGGGISFGTPSNAPGISGGEAGASGVCGGGGGGGGFITSGIPGLPCGATAGGAGGIQVTPSVFSFNGPFRGGFGGGAGGTGATTIGTGGGGGGAIRIRAGGDIIINGNITSKGGAGGASLSDGGGGGGGSGGVIWIQALGNITINFPAELDADGGSGGDGDSTGGADGSPGSRGAIRLEDFDGVIDGSGTIPGYAEILSVNGGVSGSSEKLKSSISCGTVLPKNNDGLFQMMMSFMIVVLMSKMLRRRSA